MSREKITIISKGRRRITLKQLFAGKQRARKEMANLPFEEKIKILASLQKLACSWGRKKDVMIWSV